MLKDKLKDLQEAATEKGGRLTAATLGAKRNLSERLASGGGAIDTDHVLSLDIGTEFVKALIGKVEGDSIRIIGAARGRQNLSDMNSGAIANISGVVATCERVLAKAEAQAEIDTGSCIIGIAGELVKGMTTTVKFKRPQPDSEIGYEEMEYVLDRVRSKAKDKALKQLNWELAKEDIDVRLVNSAVVALQVDGYKVTNPISFKGGEISCTLYTAFAPLVHLAALQKVAAELDLELQAVAAEPFAATRSVIGNDENNALNAILIDVGGGTTDVAVVREGGVEGTQMFGIGGRSFTKSIASAMGVSFIEAEKLKIGYSRGKLKDAHKRQVETALKETTDVWLSGVELALGEFGHIDHLPDVILLCGGGASLDLVPQALKRSKWHAELPFTREPTVKRISTDQVVNITDETGIVKDHTFITTMGLLRVGHDAIVDEIGNAKPPAARLKERVNKALRI